MSKKQKMILPVPFAISEYGTTASQSYKRILGVSAANETMSDKFPSNLFARDTVILDPVEFEILPDKHIESGTGVTTLVNLQKNLANRVADVWDDCETLLVLGGDHSISCGTGLGISRKVDMSKVALIYIDAHGDCNTPETSLSKCITGYPVAVNFGLGAEVLTEPFQDNFLKKICYIGLRDIDELEGSNLQKINAEVYSILDVMELGINKVVERVLESVKGCEYIWFSIDIDSLDAVYFESGETDVPVPGGLTPRELLYITHKVQQTGRLKVAELAQVNDIGKNTSITVLSSRIGELALGLGKYRYFK
jgi:arginase